MKYEQTLSRGYVKDEVETKVSKYIASVYFYMMIGIAVSALVAYSLVASGLMLTLVQSGGRAFFWGVFGVQFATLLWFGPLSQRAGSLASLGLFLFYATITGTTLGLAVLLYTAASFINVFAMAAFSFACLAGYGHFTRRNLNVFGTFCLQALAMLFFVTLAYMVVSMIPSLKEFMPDFSLGLSVIGVLVFSGLTAYESQKLKETGYHLATSKSSEETVSLHTIQGALSMYLNFINLFLNLLRIFGKRR